MSDICEPNGQVIDIGINVIFHMAILFSILSIFFIFYASKIISQAFERELNSMIKQNINKTLNKLPNNQQETIKAILGPVDFSRIIKYYSQTDKTVKVYNDWLFKTVIIVNILLFILVVLVITTANKLCYDVNLGHLLTENLIIFTGIGIIEFAFFKFIALRYVPAPPSLMIKTIISSLQNSLKS